MSDDNEDAQEKAWLLGNRAAWGRILTLVARELGGNTAEGRLAALLSERQETIAALRRVCADFGDNDWFDDLYIPDIIEKHLERNLRGAIDEDEG